MKRIDFETVKRFYEYFYRKRYNSEKYKYKPSARGEKIINTFINSIDKRYNLKLVGEEFLWSYFIYQFNYWRNAEIKSFYGKMQIQYIIGKKALDRYIEDANNLMWVTENSEIIDKYGFVKSELIGVENKPSYSSNYEEGVKRKNHNTYKGFYLCIENTTLYNPKHTSCLLCNYKNDCRKVLKEKFPEIYESRMK